MTVNRVGSMLTPFFAEGPVQRLRATPPAATRAPTDGFARALLAAGVYPPPSQFEAWFVGLTHGEAERSAAVREALARAAGDA